LIHQHEQHRKVPRRQLRDVPRGNSPGLHDLGEHYLRLQYQGNRAEARVAFDEAIAQYQSENPAKAARQFWQLSKW
jgi:hypothetical protein